MLNSYDYYEDFDNCSDNGDLRDYGNINSNYDIYDYFKRFYDYEDFSPTRGYQNEECFKDGYGNVHFDHDAHDDDDEEIDFNCN